VLAPDDLKQQLARLKRAAKKTPLVVSAATGQGVESVLRALLAVIGETATAANDETVGAHPWSPSD